MAGTDWKSALAALGGSEDTDSTIENRRKIRNGKARWIPALRPDGLARDDRFL